MATPNEVSIAAACWCIEAKLEALLFELDAMRVNGGGAVMTPQEVATASACWCIEDKWAAALFLGNEIVENGGGGGGGGDLTYTRSAIDPVGAPPTTYGIHWNTDTLQMFNWSGAVWI